MSASSDHVESSHVVVEVHVFSCDLHVVAGINTMWSRQEAPDFGLWVEHFGHCVDTHNDVVPASCLTSAENDTDLEFKRWLKQNQDMNLR